MAGRDSVILGISCDLHDAAAALVVDGRVVAAAEEERFSRQKHDASLPAAAVESCLRIAGVGASEVERVAFYEKPLLSLHRFLAAHRRQGPSGVASFARQMPDLLRRNLLIAYRIDKMLRDLGVRALPPVAFLEHHVSHAAAAFFPSPFERAAVLTVDGLGEWATASISRGFDHRLEPIEETRYPDSLGLFYGFATAYCGFRPNDDEYKLMGLAAYGEPRFADAVRELVGLRDDGSPRVRADRMGWFGFTSVGGREMARRLGGPARDAADPIDQRFADVAASVQLVTEEALLAMARRARDVTGERDLCVAGGVGLNVVAMGRLRREGPFERVWVQPATGDAGSAIGAALALHHRERSDGPRVVTGRDGMSGAFLGPAATPDEVAEWLSQEGVDFVRRTAGEVAERVAELLEAGRIVGVCRGRMEFGPRALGHRSILADPRVEGMRAQLNDRVKRREWFRPFAPAVLEEHASEWFAPSDRSEYMSFTAEVVAGHRRSVDHEPQDLRARADLPRSDIPACTHVDGTARVQTVSKETNPEFHDVLAAFHRRTGCPVLVNTSFNGPGEPIVASPSDALACARAIGLDVVVIEDCIVELMGESPVVPDGDGVPAGVGPVR